MTASTDKDAASKSRPADSQQQPQSTMTFTNLPREVRDQIYREALISDEVIELFRTKNVYDDEQYKWNTVPIKGIAADCLQKCAFNLLKTTKQIREEASEIFYGQNTFSFLGEHNWHREIRWLESIGDNVKYLQKLIFGLWPLPNVWQWTDGERQCDSDDEELPEGPHARNEMLKPREPVAKGRRQDWDEGEVPDIDPKLEDVFRILGNSQSPLGSKLQLIVRNHYTGIPGAFETDDMQSETELFVSMDVPNIFEVWRQRNSEDGSAGKREIDMIWACALTAEPTIEGELLDRFLGDLKSSGWDIIGFYPDGKAEYTIKDDAEQPVVIMRRRPIEGELTISEPNGGIAPPERKRRKLN